MSIAEVRRSEAMGHSWTSVSCSGCPSRSRRGGERASRRLSYLSQGLPGFRGDLPERSYQNRELDLQMRLEAAKPPGRARLSTRSLPTGSVEFANTTIGTVRVTCSNGPTALLPWATMTSGASATNSPAYRAKPFGIAYGPADIDPHVAADGPAQFRQALCERRDAGHQLRIIRGQVHEHAAFAAVAARSPRGAALPRRRARR